MSSKKLTPEETLFNQIDKDYKNVPRNCKSDFQLKIRHNGAICTSIDAMKQYAAQEVAEKDALLKEAIFWLRSARTNLLNDNKESRRKLSEVIAQKIKSFELTGLEAANDEKGD